jgi:hypothetical protein
VVLRVANFVTDHSVVQGYVKKNYKENKCHGGAEKPKITANYQVVAEMI